MSITHTDTTPRCPHCHHKMTTDEMVEHRGVDLFALAPNEGYESIKCPVCSQEYWVQGGYTPEYTSAINEDDL